MIIKTAEINDLGFLVGQLGLGGRLSWAGPARDTAFGSVTNNPHPGRTSDRRAAALIQAVRTALERGAW